MLLLVDLEVGEGDTRGALAGLDRVLGLEPGHLAAHVMRAQVLRGLGRFDEALADFKLALEASQDMTQLLAWLDEVVGAPLPEEGVAWRANWIYLRGVTRYRAGDVAGALADAVRCQEVNPRARPQGQQLRWEILFEGGRHEEALEVAESLLEASSLSKRSKPRATAWTLVARCQRALGRYAEERDALLELVALKDTVSARIRLVAALHELGDHAGAEEACTRGIDLEPSDAACWALRASARLRLGNTIDALADAEQAVQLAPQDLDYRDIAFRSALWLERWDRALFHARVRAELAPADSVSHLMLGSVQMELGQAAEAVASLRLARKIKGSAEISARLGHVLLEEGQHEEAATYLEEARSLGPAHFVVYQDLARVNLKMGRYSEALLLIRALRSLAPQQVVAFALEGDALRALGDRDGALEAYEAVLDLEPDDRRVRLARSGLWLEAGRYADALADAAALLQGEPEHADYLARRGEIYEAMQERERALADYRRVLELAPSHERAAELRAYLARDR